jgi:hypothetical protein
MPATRLVATASVAVVLALGLGACGGGQSSSSASSTMQQGNARRGFFADPKVQACLKQQGVTLPSGGRYRNGRPHTGQPPGAPNGGQRNSGRFQKLRAALQKCGVTPPDRGQNAPSPSTGTTAS